jgi:hypothetical protein
MGSEAACAMGSKYDEEDMEEGDSEKGEYNRYASEGILIENRYGEKKQIEGICCVR